MKLQWIKAHWPVTDVKAAKESLREAVSTTWNRRGQNLTDDIFVDVGIPPYTA